MYEYIRKRTRHIPGAMRWRRTRSGSTRGGGSVENSAGDESSDPRCEAWAEEEELSVARRTSYASILNGSYRLHAQK